jgi:hypothetical protein
MRLGDDTLAGEMFMQIVDHPFMLGLMVRQFLFMWVSRMEH